MNIHQMHERHRGLVEAMAEDYALAAEMCLARYHDPPETGWTIRAHAEETAATLEWNAPDTSSRRAYANEDDATRDGAYCIALAAAEEVLGHVALRRAYTRTGADWIIVPVDAEITDDDAFDLDRQDIMRLEVSGISADEEGQLRGRLRQKVDQANEAASPIPAIASVVGFRSATVLMQRA
jgi:hypothetical protein